MKNTIKFLILITLFLSSCAKEEDKLIKRIIRVTNDIKTNTTWKSENLYIIEGSVDVNSNAVLKIEAGTTIQFESGAELMVAYTNGFGVIKAMGTASKPILFTSKSAVKQAGDWNAIWLYGGSSGSAFTHCTFEYGGGYSDNYGMINMDDTKISFENCTFRYSKYYGFNLKSEARFDVFQGNSFSNIGKNPIRLYGNHMHTIGINNSFEAGSSILVRGDNVESPGSITWRKQNVPYFLEGSFNIGSASGTTLNLEPGIDIRMGSGSEILVAYAGGYGVFNASGTASEPISITSSSPFPSGGDWLGFFLYTGTSAGTTFDYCTVSHGGGYSYGGNIVLRDDVGSNVVIKNSTISYSSKYGIYKNNAGGTNPTIQSVSFSDNALGDKNF